MTTNYRTKLRKGGRPRLAGPREPSGRASRALTQRDKDIRLANAYWRDFRIFADADCAPTVAQMMVNRILGVPADKAPPLLNLVKHDKIKAREFIIALYWAATDLALAPRWRCRTFLTKRTGFDFHTPEGCRAARQVAIERLGLDAVRNLDDAILHTGLGTDLISLANDLEAIWQIWCEHGNETR